MWVLKVPCSKVLLASSAVSVFQPQLQALWQTQILQPHIIPLQAAMAPHGLKVSSPPTHPWCFAVGWGSQGEDVVTGTLRLQFQSEGAVMQYHRLPVFPTGGLASETLHSQLDIHICMSMPCHTTTPAIGILLQPANLGVCPNYRLATLSSAAAECLQCLKSLCT